jgi:hypothetical protein
MSIDNIQLSKTARRILFTKTLVEVTEAGKSGNKSSEITINCLGGNEKNILFLVKDPQNKFLGDEEMNLLSNLITACKLTMADIVLVNNTHTPATCQQLSDHFHSKKILMFGLNTSEMELPFSIPHFQIQTFNQQLYMTTPPLNQFLTNKDLKKELWLCLQKLFLNK